MLFGSFFLSAAIGAAATLATLASTLKPCTLHSSAYTCPSEQASNSNDVIARDSL